MNKNRAIKHLIVAPTTQSVTQTTKSILFFAHLFADDIFVHFKFNNSLVQIIKRENLSKFKD
ncbi:hypothetical protein BpHYR1_029147 [Brachionus plicatilis]|uniref:Uncharacterized protein n=1 Tax=Brachionus plicatilis TaxID=10195 RepID=A0A3M7QBH4_BRAPC|nr:hypothetical protein BpHYR1_029147 [Brachionus plicatilis]